MANDKYNIPHQNNSVRRRMEQNGGSDKPDNTPTEIGVHGNLAPGSHQPYVTFYIGEAAVNLGITDAIKLGSTVFQASAMAFEDAMLADFFANVLGMDRLQAYQQVVNFQAFRQARIAAHEQAVKPPAAPPPGNEAAQS